MFAIQVVFYRLVAFAIKMVGKFVPQPTPLFYCGAHSSQQLAVFITQSKAKKVLLVTDEIIRELGLAQPLCKVLEDAGVTVEIFAEVLPDPDNTIIDAGVACYKQSHCDAIVGFGGGSALDAAKLMAVMAHEPRPLKKIEGMLNIKHRGAPLYLVPTTSGTGSEVTMIAVVSDADTGVKTPVVDPKLLPIAVAIDPITMLGMPPAVTAMTGLDALTHAIEAYISRNATPESDRFSLMATELIFQHLPEAYHHGDNIVAREAMAMASCYAGLAFTKVSLGYVHGIAHQLGGCYHIPHGMANAIVLPHVLDYSEPAVKLRLRNLAVAAGLADKNKTDDMLAKAFIAKVRELNTTLNLPVYVEQLRPEDIPDIAKNALKESHYLYGVPKYMNYRQCCQLLEKLMPLPTGN